MTFLIRKETSKYILKMALPAIAGLSTQMVVSLVDTAMVGRIEDATFALAAMGLGVLATWAMVSFFSSLATGTHVVVARRFGEGKFKECGEVFSTSVLISFFVGIVVAFFVMSSAYWIGDFFAADDKVGILTGDYLTYRFLGLPFLLISISYRGFFFGVGNTKVFMYAGIVSNFCNIIFNYILIFGAFGAPEMGLAGAGLASSLATLVDALIQFAFSARAEHRKKFKYFSHFRFNSDIAKRIYSISLPVSFQNIFILVGFLSFIAITGLIGTTEQAASQAIVSLLFISIMPCFGFGIAVQTLVGNNLGGGNVSKAKFYGYETSKIAALYTVLVGFAFIVFPADMLSIITEETNVIKTAIPALQIAGFGQIFYSVGVVLSNGLQAAGKTFFVMTAEVLVNWILFIPLAYFLSITLKLGIVGAWIAVPVYVIIYSLVIFLKFRNGDWSKLKHV
ncbi:MAG: MATE family efflux transporter [Melioribacteraceae bacterium]|nr:MATE family efflux transporter [Melioribacteraceae bacterium]MCF8264410.1 MATE family efflux transporter [Melioribacteraceae bacterium]MCF8432094.1 MATE family efflux transporter [Melioribacteraceae bacterium]